VKTKIAINLGHKFVAIEAEILDFLGIQCGVHKTPGKSGWTVTELSTGIALSKSSISRSEVVNLTLNRLETAGLNLVHSQLAKLPKAPAAETLEAYVEPPKETVIPADIDGIVRLIAQRAELNQQETDAVRHALNSRTGRLKAKAPSDDWGKAAWNGLQPNAWKVQFSACWLRGEPADLLSKLAKFTWPVALDKDLSTLRALGVA
jgi:hypothetical protein